MLATVNEKRQTRQETVHPSQGRRSARRCAVSALSGLILTVALIVPLPSAAEPTPAADATLVISGSTMGSALGLALVEGMLHYRGKTYLLSIRGAAPTSDSTGKVYALGAARNIEGIYQPGDGGLRNDRGVTIVFDPPLVLTGRQLQVDLSTRMHPKGSSGQRGLTD